MTCQVWESTNLHVDVDCGHLMSSSRIYNDPQPIHLTVSQADMTVFYIAEQITRYLLVTKDNLKITKQLTLYRTNLY